MTKQEWEEIERRYYGLIKGMEQAESRGDFDGYHIIRNNFDKLCIEILESLVEENVDVLKRLKGEE